MEPWERILIKFESKYTNFVQPNWSKYVLSNKALIIFLPQYSGKETSAAKPHSAYKILMRYCCCCCCANIERPVMVENHAENICWILKYFVSVGYHKNEHTRTAQYFNQFNAETSHCLHHCGQRGRHVGGMLFCFTYNYFRSSYRFFSQDHRHSL